MSLLTLFGFSNPYRCRAIAEQLRLQPDDQARRMLLTNLGFMDEATFEALLAEEIKSNATTTERDALRARAVLTEEIDRVERLEAAACVAEATRRQLIESECTLKGVLARLDERQKAYGDFDARCRAMISEKLTSPDPSDLMVVRQIDATVGELLQEQVVQSCLSDAVNKIKSELEGVRAKLKSIR